jgi:hypothetical protein
MKRVFFRVHLRGGKSFSHADGKRVCVCWPQRSFRPVQKVREQVCWKGTHPYTTIKVRRKKEQGLPSGCGSIECGAAFTRSLWQKRRRQVHNLAQCSREHNLHADKNPPARTAATSCFHLLLMRRICIFARVPARLCQCSARGRLQISCFFSREIHRDLQDDEPACCNAATFFMLEP